MLEANVASFSIRLYGHQALLVGAKQNLKVNIKYECKQARVARNVCSAAKRCFLLRKSLHVRMDQHHYWDYFNTLSVSPTALTIKRAKFSSFSSVRSWGSTISEELQLENVSVAGKSGAEKFSPHLTTNV